MLETGGTSPAREMCVLAGPVGDMCVPKPSNRKTSSASRLLLTFLLLEPRRTSDKRTAQLIRTLLTSRLITILLNSLRCYATLRATVKNHMAQQIDILVLHEYATRYFMELWPLSCREGSHALQQQSARMPCSGANECSTKL